MNKPTYIDEAIERFNGILRQKCPQGGAEKTCTDCGELEKAFTSELQGLGERICEELEKEKEDIPSPLLINEEIWADMKVRDIMIEHFKFLIRSLTLPSNQKNQ